MTFAPPRIIHCPHCRKLFMSENIGSGNTFGAIFWSDGYYISQMLPVPPVLAWCNYCNLWFFLEDAVFMFEVPFGCDFPEEDTITMYDNLDALHYQHALNQFGSTGISSVREEFLRTRLWWLLNHSFRGVHEKPPITAEQLANLERLLELRETQNSPIKTAEIYRELGEFDKCIDLLQKIDLSDEERETAEQIIREAMNRNIYPFRLKKTDGDSIFAKKQSVRKAVVKKDPQPDNPMGQDYSVFPDHADIFAFPKKYYIQETEPLLSVRLDEIHDDWEGWATFFYKECDYLYRYNRLFSEEDWDMYRRLEPEMKQKLLWFWSQTYERVQNERRLRERYYCMLYRCYHVCFHNFGQEDLELFQTIFDYYWEEILEEAESSPTNVFNAVMEMKEEIYWYTLWNSTEEWLCYIDVPNVLEFVEETIAKRERVKEHRKKAIKGLDDIELGGFPSWFQGIDQTPLDSKGEPMEFIGQFWTDCLGVPGAMLIYLFYDPIERRFKQVYDYD